MGEMNISDYFNDYLDFLENQVVTILIHDKMFKEVGELIKSNTTINHNNSFYDWMISAYVSDITIRIRRLVDEDKKTKSFVNFLKELQSDTQIRTRSRHVGFYKTNLILADIGERTFDGLAGVGASEYGVDLVQSDIDDLKRECKAIVVYTHNFIAHSNAKLADGKVSTKLEIPTFTDLDVAIKHLDKLLIKYFLLLKASGKGESLMPYWQYNWKSIFEVPWLLADET
jgi:hypothetical protein